MIQKSSVYITVIALLAICLLAAVGVLVIQAANASKPAPSTVTPAATATPGAAVTFAVVEPLPTQTPVVIETATHSVQTCGMSGSMTLLSIGRDAHYWETPHGADAIRLVRVDFSRREVAIFAFPRDLQLQTGDLIESYGVETARLGQVYLAVLENERGNPNPDVLATGQIAQLLYHHFGVKPDHYVVIEENLIEDLVDTLGGVDVNIPVAVKAGDFTLYAGPQHLDGHAVQIYTRRLSSTEQEWERFARQNLVFTGLRRQLIRPGVLQQVPELYRRFQDSVVTDLSLSQVVTLSCAIAEIPLENVTFDSIRRELVSVHEDGSITINDPAEIQKLLAELEF